MSERPSNLLCCAQSVTLLRDQPCMRLPGFWSPWFQLLPLNFVQLHPRPWTMPNLSLTKDSSDQNWSSNSSEFSERPTHLMINGLFGSEKSYLRTPFKDIIVFIQKEEDGRKGNEIESKFLVWRGYFLFPDGVKHEHRSHQCEFF